MNKPPATAAIQKTIAAAVAAVGGEVLVPAGKFLAGPFTLASSLNLHLAKDAVILINDDRTTYPVARGRYVFPKIPQALLKSRVMKKYLTGALDDGTNGFWENWVQRHAGHAGGYQNGAKLQNKPNCNNSL